MFFWVRPQPRDLVRHALAGLVIQPGGRGSQASSTILQLPGAILRAFNRSKQRTQDQLKIATLVSSRLASNWGLPSQSLTTLLVRS